MDNLGYYYRIRIGVAPTEDRVRSLRERRLRPRPEARRHLPAPRQDGRRRLSIAGLIGLVVAKRNAMFRPRKATTSSAKHEPVRARAARVAAQPPSSAKTAREIRDTVQIMNLDVAARARAQLGIRAADFGPSRPMRCSPSVRARSLPALSHPLSSPRPAMRRAQPVRGLTDVVVFGRMLNWRESGVRARA